MSMRTSDLRTSVPHTMRGLTLIEVLITLFIFAIGLLGVAGMQAIAKKANFEAVQRTTATFVAYDIIERMRANSDTLNLYLAAGIGGGSLAAPGTDCSAADCTTNELATYDLYSWEQALDGTAEQSAAGNAAGGLVDPTGCVTGPAAGVAGVYTVAVAWRGSSALSNPTIDPCGEGTGKYGETDEYRRILVVTTFITPT
jgi:type IV pilus assembly protein PilV